MFWVYGARWAALEWATTNRRIILGWGDIGPIDQYETEEQIGEAIQNQYDDPPLTVSNGIASLMDFRWGMQEHDLVILSTGKGGQRAAVMEVTGGYEYRELSEVPGHPTYRHQRSVLVRGELDPDALWDAAGGMAPGQSIHRALVRCTNPVNEVNVPGKRFGFGNVAMLPGD